MHVVLAGQSATGHVYPLLSLADALRAAGHGVSFATTADLVPWLNELGYRASPVGQTIPWALAQVQARSPELTSDLPPGEAWRLDAELFADALPRSTTPDLVELLSALRPDLVVYESTAFGAVLAAAEVGIPVVCLDLWAVGHWHVDRGELEGRVRAVWADRTGAPLRVDPISGMAHLDPAPAALRTADDHDSTRLEMRQVSWGDPALSLSPWVSSERSRPLVYLTLGTVGWGRVEVLQECLSGLSALPVDVLVAVGAYFDPADLGPLPASVHVERFVRQDLLLGEVTIAVHHGGSGTLLGAAAHGVPQLVMPMGADQFQNAEALVRSGAGLALSHGGVTAQTVRDGVLELLEEPRYRTSAGELRSEIQAMPTPAATIPRLVELAQSPGSDDIEGGADQAKVVGGW